MAVKAVSLNRIVQFKRGDLVDDGLASKLGNWRDHGQSVFANRQDVADTERLSAASWGNKLVVRFIIRASGFARGLKRTDMIAHEGTPYQIDGIRELSGNSAFLEITAVTSEGLAVNAPFEV